MTLRLPIRPAHLAVALPLLLASGLAAAHPGHIGSPDWSGGFIHPFTGLDHLVAMLALGVWAALQGGAARWRSPLSFAGALAVGAGAACVLPALPASAVDLAAAATLPVLGALMLRPGWRGTGSRVLPFLLGAVHGLAHGLDLRSMAAGGAAEWIVGASAATLLLHGIGLAIGTPLARTRVGQRIAAVVTAGTGLALLATL